MREARELVAIDGVGSEKVRHAGRRRVPSGIRPWRKSLASGSWLTSGARKAKATRDVTMIAPAMAARFFLKRRMARGSIEARTIVARIV